MLSNMNGALIKRGEIHRDIMAMWTQTCREAPWKDGEEDGRMNPQAQEHQGLPAATRSQAGGREHFLPHSLQRNNSANTLISASSPPEPWEEKFLLFQGTQAVVLFTVPLRNERQRLSLIGRELEEALRWEWVMNGKDKEQPSPARTKNFRKGMMENTSLICHLTTNLAGIPWHFFVLRETFHPSLHLLYPCGADGSCLPPTWSLLLGHSDCEGGCVT